MYLQYKVMLELAMNYDAPANLSEMGFHIPGMIILQSNFVCFCNQSNHSDPLSVTEQAGKEGADPAEAFRDHVVKKVNIANTCSDDAITFFMEITTFSFMQEEDAELELPFTEEELKKKYGESWRRRYGASPSSWCPRCSACTEVPISGLDPDRDQCPNMVPKKARFAS